MGGKKRKSRATRAIAGGPPGILVPDPDAPRSQVTVMCFSPDHVLERDGTALADLPALVAENRVTWVNVNGLGDGDTIQRLGDVFGLHRLALEDVVNTYQRSKLEDYEGHLYIVGRMPEFEEGELVTEQLSMFVGEGWVLTFQERPGDCFDPLRSRIRGARGIVRQQGADYLAYALLDAVVDSYFPLLEQYGEKLDEVEREILTQPDTPTIVRIQQIKKDLLTMRRSIWPMRDVLNEMARDPISLFTDHTRVYLRDAYDHASRIVDLLETYREVGSGLMDFYHSSMSNRMNEVMKVLTVISTIFIPLGFIAGVYGMNFDPDISPWNMPEVRWAYGYPMALLIMGVVAGLLIAYFWRRGWVGAFWNRRGK